MVGKGPHLARECPHRGPQPTVCFSLWIFTCAVFVRSNLDCNMPGHMAKDCPNVCLETLSRVANIPSQAKDGPVCYNCRQPGHLARNCPQAPAPSKPAGVCYTCGQPGHLARNCPQHAPVTTQTCFSPSK